VTPQELELAALCGIAWERRGEPDFRTHIEAIVDWHDRRHIRAHERKQRELAALVLLIRDPSKGGRRRAA
jgi:hypothetical protein